MKQIRTLLVLTCFLLSAVNTSYGQCGDDCATATLITVTANGPCIYDSCSNIGATASNIPTLPCSGAFNNDVWYTFTVPAGVTSLVGQVLGAGPGYMNTPIIYFYRGTCGALSALGCNTGNPPSSIAYLQYSSFIPGEQIWVRVKPLGGTPDGSFQLCVYNPCPLGVPLNDNPCSATVVPMTANCTGYVSISNFCATSTTGVPGPACGNYLGGDVWVQTIVGANGHLEVNFEMQSMVDPACAVYTGTCSTLTLVACSDVGGTGTLPYLFITTLTPNDTVWIRVWAAGNTGTGTTGICLTDPCPGGTSSNDEPCSARVLPLSANCGTYSILSNVCASASTGIPIPGCGNYAGGDVWAQTTVGAGGYVDVNFQEQSLSDVGAALYSGTCSTLTLLACDDDNGAGAMPHLVGSGLTPGDTVWIRVWDYGNNNIGSVGICVVDPCPSASLSPPLFDDPPCPLPDSASWYLPVSFGTCTSDTNFSSLCANSVFGTTPPGIPFPSGCATGYPPGAVTGWDVWAPFVIPDTLTAGRLNINTQAGSIFDLDMALYRLASPVDSNCSIGSNYTLVDCDDNDGPGSMPFLQLAFGGANTLQPGDTLLVRMWNHFGGLPGNWGICVSIACLGGTPGLSAYDDPPCPATAVLLPVTQGPCSSYYQADNTCATTTTSQGSPSCGFWNNAADVWYVVQMPASSSGVIEINFQSGLSLADLAAAVYTGLPVACGGTGLTQIACDDDDGLGTLPFISLNNPVNPGEYLFIRVWAYDGTGLGNFGICVNDPCEGMSLDSLLFEDPPCPMPDMASAYLQVTNGLCPAYAQCDSRCAVPFFGTTPAGVPLPSGCSGPSYPPGAATGWDVWTPVVVPDTPLTGMLNIRATAGTITDLDLALYRITPPVSLNCGNGVMYNHIACDDLNGTGAMPFLSQPYGGANTIQPGDTLLVRMWRKNGGATGTWSLAANISDIPSDSICMVRIDSISNKNAVIWEKSGDPGIYNYRIYKEMSPGGFTLLGTLTTATQSVYVDNASTPALSAERYAISITDTCGYEYMLSRPHRTIHLAVTPDSTGTWNLAWNPYEGIDYTYTYILRGATLNNLSVIDSVPAMQSAYSDTSAPPGTVYYAVEIRKQPGCFPTPNPNGTRYNNSRSNTVSSLSVGLGQDLRAVAGIQIYPNPALHSTEISFSLVRTGAVRVSILDISGREVSQLLNSNLMAGQHRVEWDVSDPDPAASGVYLIRVESGNYSETRRVIVMPH